MIKSNFEKLRRKKSYEENRDLTVRTMAAESNLSLSTIVKWKAEAPVRIDVETLNSLCKYFDCQVGDLIEYVAEK